jgi:hypothetical protein
MLFVGMDIHRSFAQVAILEDGRITQELRVDLVDGPLVNFAKTLSIEDDVVIEATGNTAAAEKLMRPYVKRMPWPTGGWFGRLPMHGSTSGQARRYDRSHLFLLAQVMQQSKLNKVGQ